ncbi:molybdate ABC transporter permease subunit [Nodosilinea sp. LEGE 07088]|uniref:molybdate ABC transporter permease subunit n=1 Tax=Nodosilinea sp. LEGE 07088 TaxID=2777968 RepID=UPI0018823669|nr:molybdate ABC transporter permease subunit [Nodosilinea sp. LEGE 07088]MBE9138674.1 molybdate ABC transporter permease subunit [Nodosilinea sp. LEGE 07088]
MFEDLTPLWISLKTAFVATLLASLLGIVAARWMMGYRGRGRGWIDGVFTLPLVLPPTVVGFLLLLLLGKNSPLGQLLSQLGVTLIFTWTATVMAATVVAFPLMYKTVLSAFEQVDLTLISSAQTLGASDWRIFWQLLLPLAWPGVLAGTILAFARALGEFGATLMVGGSIPGVTQTIPIAIFFAAEAGRMGVALAWVLLMVGISLAVIAGLNRGDRRRSASTVGHGPLAQRCFNGLFFGRFAPHLFKALPPAFTPPSHFEAAAAIPDGAPPALRVNIEKQIPGFDLKIRFRAGRDPLGLLGASGSGKSMTLRCIAGLENPTHGKIVLNGRVLFDAEAGINVPSRDRKVGLVFQNYALFPHLTVAQNIAFGMAAVPKPQRVKAVITYLEQMGLAGLGDRYPDQLSGGQQQRVALARALAIQPDILLLDEPLSALDTYLRSQIERLLISVLSRYPGVALFITHKLEEAYRVCPDLLVLSRGRMLAKGPKEDIFARPPTFEVAQVTECKNFSRARPGLGTTDPPPIEAVDWGCSLEVIDPVPPGLAHLGIRAHHIRFPRHPDQSNTFPGWIAATSETQHRVSLYIKLHRPPDSPYDYHLQAEVYREKWELLRSRPFPWNVRLDPVHLIMLPD